MNFRTRTNEEFIRSLRDDHTLTPREIEMLDRIITMSDEIDDLVQEIEAVART